MPPPPTSIPASTTPALLSPALLSPGLLSSASLCEHITRTQAKNFYYGLRTTPQAKRDALYAIYAWMRLLDDLVDEPETFAALSAPAHPAGPHTSLEDFLTASRACFHSHNADTCVPSLAHPPTPTTNSPSNSPTIWPALAHTLRTQPIDARWLELMIQGVLADSTQAQPANTTDLLNYCHHVGGTVGLCCTAVWGLSPNSSLSLQQALTKADHRGRAFQIINILRDIAKDASLSPQRCYIPQDLLARESLTLSDLLAFHPAPPCERVVRALITLARDELRASQGLERALMPPCGAALWTMTRIYTRLLLHIEHAPRAAVASSPVRVPKAIKLGYALASTMLPRIVVKVQAW